MPECSYFSVRCGELSPVPQYSAVFYSFLARFSMAGRPLFPLEWFDKLTKSERNAPETQSLFSHNKWYRVDEEHK